MGTLQSNETSKVSKVAEKGLNHVPAHHLLGVFTSQQALVDLSAVDVESRRNRNRWQKVSHAQKGNKHCFRIRNNGLTSRGQRAENLPNYSNLIRLYGALREPRFEAIYWMEFEKTWEFRVWKGSNIKMTDADCGESYWLLFSNLFGFFYTSPFNSIFFTLPYFIKECANYITIFFYEIYRRGFP